MKERYRIMKVIATEKAPAAIGPYSQAYVNNGVLYTSGQLGINPETGNLGGDTPTTNVVLTACAMTK